MLSGRAMRGVERTVRAPSVAAGPRIIRRVEGSRELAAKIGRIGLWCSQLQWQPAAREQEAVAELEELGCPAVWVGEATGKEALTHAGLLLAGTRRIVVATGI